jgi:hypothetical protein
VNGGYSAAHFTQERRWHQEVNYTGHFVSPVAMSATLAVDCGPQTKQFFQDLGNTSEPCITQDKIDIFQTRSARERRAKNQKLAALNDRLANGQITPEAYDRLLAFYNTNTITDGLFMAEIPKRLAGAKENQFMLIQPRGQLGELLQPQVLAYTTTLPEAQLRAIEDQIIGGH